MNLNVIVHCSQIAWNYPNGVSVLLCLNSAFFKQHIVIPIFKNIWNTFIFISGYCVDWLDAVWQNSNTTKSTHPYCDSTQLANSVYACMCVRVIFRKCLICFCSISFATCVVPVKHSIITHTNSDYNVTQAPCYQFGLPCVTAWFVLQLFSHQNPEEIFNQSVCNRTMAQCPWRSHDGS